MRAIARRFITEIFALALMLALGGALAQDRPAATQERLDQMLAPIALYPDALLSQILMASTYPLEVVEAARWSRGHPNLAGDDAVRAAANEDWDPSVKSLLAFPQVLARMDENLQWTQSLGDAFLDQQQQVMDTVQNLRHRAQEAGNLRSDDHLRVVDSGPDVMVEYVDPQLVYVPYYDPTVVYGTWWWPVQPIYWQPWPGYYPWPGFAFYWGPPIGISVGFFFGGCDWHHRQVRVTQVNNYYVNNATIDRRRDGINHEPGVWRHDPAHRRGVAYSSARLRQRFGAADMRRDADIHADGHPEPHDDRRDAARPAAQPAAPPQVNTGTRIDGRERRDRASRAWNPQQTHGAETVPEKRESRPESGGRRREEHSEPAARIEAPRVVEDRARMPHGGPEAGVETGRHSQAMPPAAESRGRMPHPQPEPPRQAATHTEQHHEPPGAKEKADK